MSDTERTITSVSSGQQRGLRRFTRSTHIWAAIYLVLALVSLFVLAPISRDPALLHGLIGTLEEQLTQVVGLSTGALTLAGVLSVASSASLKVGGAGFDPGAALTPVAERATDVSSWLLIVLGAIVLQKVLLTVVGTITFAIVLPAGALFGIVALYSGSGIWRQIALKLAAFAVVLLVAVPGSIWLSSYLTANFANFEAAQDALAQAKEIVPAESATGSENLFDAIGDFFASAGAAVGNAIGSLKDAVGEALNDMVMTFVYTLITSCVVPVLSLFLLAWVIKLLFSGGTSSRRSPTQPSQSSSVREADNSTSVDLR